MNYIAVIGCLWLLSGTLLAEQAHNDNSAKANIDSSKCLEGTCHVNATDAQPSPGGKLFNKDSKKAEPKSVDGNNNTDGTVASADVGGSTEKSNVQNEMPISSEEGNATVLEDGKGNTTATTATTSKTTSATSDTSEATANSTDKTTTTPTTLPTTPPTPTTTTPATTPSTPSTTPSTPSTTPSTPKSTPSPSTSTTTVISTVPVETTVPTKAPTTSSPDSERRFDGPSFIGGIVFALGVTAICFVAWKFYKARTERNYHTL